MSRLRDQRGFTLIELLVAMLIMLVVLTATVDSFARFMSNQRGDQELQDQQASARVAVDQIVRQLRNLANPTTVSQATVDTAGNNRLIFQTTDPAKQWVMYCLNRTVAPASATNEYLWYQVSQTQATVTAAMRTGCPSTDAGWTKNTLLSSHVTNNATTTRPLFSYTSINPSTGAVSSLPAAVSAANRPLITLVNTNIWVDNDVNKPPAETAISSGAYMRNQNQAPAARFDLAPAGGNKFTFNASASSDPEGRTLNYSWYEERGTPTSVPSAAPTANCPTGQTCLPDCPSSTTLTFGGATWKCIGDSQLVTHDFTGETSTQNVWLRVVDPGSLGDLSDATSTNACVAAAAGRTTTQCANVSFAG